MKRLLTTIVAVVMVLSSLITVPFMPTASAQNVTPTDIDSATVQISNATLTVNGTQAIVSFDWTASISGTSEGGLPPSANVNYEVSLSAGGEQITASDNLASLALTIQESASGSKTVTLALSSTVSYAVATIKVTVEKFVLSGNQPVLASAQKTAVWGTPPTPPAPEKVYFISKSAWSVYKNAVSEISGAYIYTVDEDKNIHKVKGGEVYLIDPAGNKAKVADVAADGSFAFKYKFTYEGVYRLVYKNSDGEHTLYNYCKYLVYGESGATAGYIISKGKFSLDQPKDISIESMRSAYVAGVEPDPVVVTVSGKIWADPAELQDNIDRPEYVRIAYHDVRDLVMGSTDEIQLLPTGKQDGSFAARVDIPSFATSLVISSVPYSDWNWKGMTYRVIPIKAPAVNISIENGSIYPTDEYNANDGNAQSIKAIVTPADGGQFIGSAHVVYAWYLEDDSCPTPMWVKLGNPSTASLAVVGDNGKVEIPVPYVEKDQKVKLVILGVYDDKMAYQANQGEFKFTVGEGKCIESYLEYSKMSLDNTGKNIVAVGNGKPYVVATFAVIAKIADKEKATGDYVIKLKPDTGVYEQTASDEIKLDPADPDHPVVVNEIAEGVYEYIFNVKVTQKGKLSLKFYPVLVKKEEGSTEYGNEKTLPSESSEKDSVFLCDQCKVSGGMSAEEPEPVSAIEGVCEASYEFGPFGVIGISIGISSDISSDNSCPSVVHIGDQVCLKVVVKNFFDGTPINNAVVTLYAYKNIFKNKCPSCVDSAQATFAEILKYAPSSDAMTWTIDPDWNVAGGVYDFNKRFSTSKNKEFVAKHAGFVGAKVVVSGIEGKLTSPIVITPKDPILTILPNNDIKVNVKYLTDVVPAEKVKVEISAQLPEDLKGVDLYVCRPNHKIGNEGQFVGLYDNQCKKLTADSSYKIAFYADPGSYVVKAVAPYQADDPNKRYVDHVGKGYINVPGNLKIALDKDLLTNNLYYTIHYKVLFNDKPYNASYVKFYTGAYDKKHYPYWVYGLFKSDKVTYVPYYSYIKSIPVNGEGVVGFAPVFENNGLINVAAYKDVEIGGETYTFTLAKAQIPVECPKLYAELKDGSTVALDGNSILGYINIDNPIVIHFERAEGGPIANAKVIVSGDKVTGVYVNGYTDDSGRFAVSLHPLASGNIDIKVQGFVPKVWAYHKVMDAYFHGCAKVEADRNAPIIKLISPELATDQVTVTVGLTTKKITVVGKACDKETGIKEVLVNGVPVALVGKEFTKVVSLDVGENLITIQAVDNAGNVTTKRFVVVVPTDTEPPVVKITSPVVPEGALVAETDQQIIEVKGTVTDNASGVKAVYVNGMPATVIGNTFSAKVKLDEGANVIEVIAIDGAGNTSDPVQVTVVYDPYLNKTVIELAAGSQFYKVNGETKVMDVAPFINSDNRTMVPVRFIAEALGLSVKWDGDKRQVIITGNDKQIVLTIDSNIAMVDGIPVKMDTKAIIVNNRTFVPLRFVAEAFGFQVEWIPPVTVRLIKEK